ncbi:hypothetical protein ZEAMMB73_Zm00001d008518 [Zea mays]|uniref:Uncharacterized protein n=1 Tax=Zea mays TaxID=4577 RepID=A0A1D6FDR2_MAIZE|nr:hypothetical protein ZEAMMB73_Zm00001d008518 [Zea mays]
MWTISAACATQIRRICASTAFPTGAGRCRRRRRRFLRSCPSRRSASTLRATACCAATGSHSSPSTLTRGSSLSYSSVTRGSFSCMWFLPMQLLSDLKCTSAYLPCMHRMTSVDRKLTDYSFSCLTIQTYGGG